MYIPTATPTICGLSYPVADGFEGGDLGSFVSSVATCVPGGCGWTNATDHAHAGTHSVYAPRSGQRNGPAPRADRPPKF